MKRLTLDLKLEADVIQSESAITTGSHRSLSYLRGSTLLGAAAARCYAALGEDAFVAFHSGRVRYGDAVPVLEDGVETWPVPLSWMAPKSEPLTLGASRGDAAPLNAGALYNSCHAARPDPTWKQIREGYLTRDGRYHLPDRRYRLKTAIDRTAGGRAQSGQLFGYEALPAGSRWRAQIDFDDDVSSEVVDTIRGTYEREVLWLGRSRGAEYGRVRVTEARLGSVEVDGAAAQVREALIALQSDVALVDSHTRMPSLAPTAEVFGLPETWHYVPRRSAVMTRRYAPFNGKRRHRDLERQVLRRGTVLVFEGEEPADLVRVRRAVHNGVGAYRYDGLGQVLVQPWFLDGPQPTFTEAVAETAPAAGERLAPPTALAGWMARELESQTQIAEAIDEALAASKRIAGIVAGLRGKETPGRSQWQLLAAHVEQEWRKPAPSIESLRRRLADHVFRSGAEARGVAARYWMAEHQRKELSEWVLSLGLGKAEWADGQRLLCLQLTARETSRLLGLKRPDRDATKEGSDA